MDALIHTPQLAQILGVSARTLEDWRLDGRGPRFTKVGHRVAYRERDVNAWLDAQAAPA